MVEINKQKVYGCTMHSISFEKTYGSEKEPVSVNSTFQNSLFCSSSGEGVPDSWTGRTTHLVKHVKRHRIQSETANLPRKGWISLNSIFRHFLLTLFRFGDPFFFCSKIANIFTNKDLKCLPMWNLGKKHTKKPTNFNHCGSQETERGQ